MLWKIQSPYLEITSQCNLCCRHCYNSSTIENVSELSNKQVLNCIAYFAEAGVSNISISGGEPLLHRDIVKILKCAHDHGLSVLLATNGTLLESDIIRDIKKYVTYYQISIDGTRESHDVIRGSGSYRAAMQGIYRLCNAGLQKQTRIRMTLTGTNFEDIESVVREAIFMGLEAVQFSIVRCQGRASFAFKEKHQLSDSALISLYYKVEELCSQYVGTIDIGRLSIDGGNCGLLKSECVIMPRIDAYGSVFPCQGFQDNKYRLGTIEDGLDLVFSNDNITYFVNKLKKYRLQSKECNECYWNKVFCHRGCPAESYQKGSIMGTDGMCEVRKVLWSNQIFNRCFDRR